MWLLIAGAVLIWQLLHHVPSFLHSRKYIHLYGCQPPPHPPQLDPIFGLDLVINFFRVGNQNRRLQAIEDAHSKYGKTYSSRVLGRTATQTIDVRNVQSIFATDASSYEIGNTRGAAMDPFIGREGVFCSEGGEWKRGRVVLLKAFSRMNISHNMERFSKCVDRMIGEVLIPKDGETVNLGVVFANLNLDAATSLIFGEEMDLQTSRSEESREFLQAFDTGKSGVAVRFLLGGRLNLLYRSKGFVEACAVVRRWAEFRVKDIRSRPSSSQLSEEERKSSPSKPETGRYHDLGTELASQITDDRKLRHELLNTFFAGHDNPGITLTSIFFSLARHPEVWSKLRQEVLAKNNNVREINFEYVKSLKYLTYVINESLRLYPVVPQNTRICIRPTHLPSGGGPLGTQPVYIYPGDRVSVNFWTLYRSKEHFGDDADSFRPERWETLKPGWEFIPFSGGPRTCPAQLLSRVWIGYVLIRMAREFKEVVNRDPVWEFVEETKLSLESKNGALVSLVRA